MSTFASDLADESFLLPDLFSLSAPLKCTKSPHYERAAAESSAWVAKYAGNIFDDQERAAFAMCCFGLLVASSCPYAAFEEFRTVCDFVNVLFVVHLCTLSS